MIVPILFLAPDRLYARGFQASGECSPCVFGAGWVWPRLNLSLGFRTVYRCQLLSPFIVWDNITRDSRIQSQWPWFWWTLISSSLTLQGTSLYVQYHYDWTSQHKNAWFFPFLKRYSFYKLPVCLGCSSTSYMWSPLQSIFIMMTLGDGYVWCKPLQLWLVRRVTWVRWGQVKRQGICQILPRVCLSLIFIKKPPLCSNRRCSAVYPGHS